MKFKKLSQKKISSKRNVSLKKLDNIEKPQVKEIGEDTYKTDDVRQTRWEKMRQEREERKSKKATKRLPGPGKKRITGGKKEDEQV